MFNNLDSWDHQTLLYLQKLAQEESIQCLDVNKMIWILWVCPIIARVQWRAIHISCSNTVPRLNQESGCRCWACRTWDSSTVKIWCTSTKSTTFLPSSPKTKSRSSPLKKQLGKYSESIKCVITLKTTLMMTRMMRRDRSCRNQTKRNRRWARPLIRLLRTQTLNRRSQKVASQWSQIYRSLRGQ